MSLQRGPSGSWAPYLVELFPQRGYPGQEEEQSTAGGGPSFVPTEEPARRVQCCREARTKRTRERTREAGAGRRVRDAGSDTASGTGALEGFTLIDDNFSGVTARRRGREESQHPTVAVAVAVRSLTGSNVSG